MPPKHRPSGMRRAPAQNDVHWAVRNNRARTPLVITLHPHPRTWRWGSRRFGRDTVNWLFIAVGPVRILWMPMRSRAYVQDREDHR